MLAGLLLQQGILKCTTKVHPIFSIVNYRDIPALSPILEDTALASGPKLRGPLICVECFAQISTEAASVLTCSKCGLPFCSEACRRTQRLHRVECRYVAKAQVG